MYLLRCKYLHLFKKIVLGHLKAILFYNYKKETVKIRYPHDVNIILFQNIQFKNIFNSVI